MPLRFARNSGLLWHQPGTARQVALTALFLLFGSTSLQNAVAEGDTRTLSFQHTHRDDSITVTFKRNGRYDEEGLKKLNYFLRDWRNNEQTQMAPQLFDVLWEVYREVGAKEPIHIVSSYRSPQTNAMLRRRSHGVAKFSQHMLGKAIDFFIPGVPLEQLRYAGLRQQRGGVGFYPTSGSPFVHVDVGSIRHWPRMTHDQLARVFPDGRTVHVPSDGRPLKNYQAALAEVRRRGGTPSETSLAAASGAGIETADAGGAAAGRGRNFLAKLLGIGREEEDESETATSRNPEPAAAKPKPARRDVAAVPMPRSRPSRGGEFSLASASTTPVPSPAEVINSRGYWPTGADPAQSADHDTAAADGQAMAAAAPASAPPQMEQVSSSSAPQEAVSRNGERLAWVTGPDGQSVPPRPPRDIEPPPAAAAAAADASTSVASWTSHLDQNDRSPTDAALAYAAATGSEPTANPAAAPMGALRPPASASAGNATIATKRPAINSPAAKIVQRGMDPWLRGVVMAPSVHYSVTVVTLGAPDYRSLRPLMHKPGNTVAMVFSNDPTLGLTSVQFSGAAISFLPTISYQTRTAGLN